MTSRGILSRIAAKAALAKKAKKAKKAPVAPKVEEPKTILMVDVESGKVLETFASVEEAVEKQELNRPNLLGALKNGNKYKGTHWKEV